jgi:hypothetical protein
LSPTEQEQFRKNYLSEDGEDSDFQEYLNDEYASWIDFISSGFGWEESPEGLIYWYEISERNPN